jgi:hypothetical protein
MTNKRKLKILIKYFLRRWKDVIFHEIRLAGKWLQDSGFICGQEVTIVFEANTIIITSQMPPAIDSRPQGQH